MRSLFNSIFNRNLWIIYLILLLVKSNLVLFDLYILNPLIILLSTISIMPILILISFSFLFNKSGHYIYLFTLYVGISLLFFSDIIYSKSFGHIINIESILMYSSVKDGLSSNVLSLIRLRDLILIIDIPILYVLTKNSRNIVTYRKNIPFFLFTLILNTFFFYKYINYLEENHLITSKIHNPVITSPLGAHFIDIYELVNSRKYMLNDGDISCIDNWYKTNKTYHDEDITNTELRGILGGKNIIVIQFESLEENIINMRYEGQEITPNINRLLSSSIYFNNIKVQTKDGNSSDAEFLFNTSLYPLDNGSVFIKYDNNVYLSLANLLKDYGYTSIAIHGDNKEFWNRDIMYPLLGFDQYIDQDKFDDSYQVYEGMGILDEYLFKQSIKEIKTITKPYYFYIVTMTSHMPFDIDDSIKYLNLSEENHTTNYLQSIHYADRVFGMFFNALGKEGLLANTAIVIYGDHEGVSKYFSSLLPDNNNKVPYIVYSDGIEGKIVNKVGGQIDMLPTLTYLLGTEHEYTNYFMGSNLLDNSEGYAIIPNNGVVGQVPNIEFLSHTRKVSELIVKGDYFRIIFGKKIGR